MSALRLDLELSLAKTIALEQQCLVQDYASRWLRLTRISLGPGVTRDAWPFLLARR